MTAVLGVGTLNLFSGRSLEPGADGGPLVDPARLRTAGELLAARGVEVLAVQEVDRDQPRSAGVDQLAALAEGFGATHHRFTPTLAGVPGPGRGWQPVTGDGEPAAGPSYGVGLVSRRPVLEWHVLRLRGSRVVLPVPVPGAGRLPRVLWVPDEPRAALAAVVEGPSGPVTVVSTHLSFAPVAALRQLAAVRRWAAGLPGPRVLAGDLNLPGRVPARRTGWHALVRARTFPAATPRLQLDHLLCDRPPSAPVDGEAVRLTVSDHRALLARLPLP